MARLAKARSGEGSVPRMTGAVVSLLFPRKKWGFVSVTSGSMVREQRRGVYERPELTVTVCRCSVSLGVSTPVEGRKGE